MIEFIRLISSAILSLASRNFVIVPVLAMLLLAFIDAILSLVKGGKRT